MGRGQVTPLHVVDPILCEKIKNIKFKHVFILGINHPPRFTDKLVCPRELHKRLRPWSKGADLRSAIQMYAWVQTPQRARCIFMVRRQGSKQSSVVSKKKVDSFIPLAFLHSARASTSLKFSRYLDTDRSYPS